MPEGTPGRDSFKAIPKEMRKFWRPEALALRKLFPITGAIHAVFVLSDIFVFGEILMIIADIALVWLDFYNYMILNKVVIGIEIMI
jgi:hypothetical protein